MLCLAQPGDPKFTNRIARVRQALNYDFNKHVTGSYNTTSGNKWGWSGVSTDWQAMCSAAAVVGGAVAQWAETQGKHDLFDSVDFSAPDLLHQTEADCLTNCTDIYNAGNANITALTTAGTLAAADLTDLNTKITAFNTLLTSPRQAKAGTKAATDLLPDKIDAGDRICERQLDRLMERYQISNADFYGAYQVARIIVDAGGGPGTPPPPTPAAPKP